MDPKRYTFRNAYSVKAHIKIACKSDFFYFMVRRHTHIESRTWVNVKIQWLWIEKGDATSHASASINSLMLIGPPSSKCVCEREKARMYVFMCVDKNERCWQLCDGNCHRHEWFSLSNDGQQMIEWTPHTCMHTQGGNCHYGRESERVRKERRDNQAVERGSRPKWTDKLTEPNWWPNFGWPAKVSTRAKRIMK